MPVVLSLSIHSNTVLHKKHGYIFFSAEMYLNIQFPPVIGNVDESKNKKHETQLK